MSRFLVTWFMLRCIILATAQQCPSHQHPSIKLTITSERNSTGHWIAKVKENSNFVSLNHGAHQNEVGPWEVDVDHSSAKCDDEESVHLATTITAPPQHLHLKYKLLPELGYYKFHDIPTSWYKAEVTCREENGHLLVLNSPKEFMELKKIWDASGVKGDYLHLGINDFDKEKEFVTVLGDLLNSTGYAQWGPNEPNSGDTANCGAVRRTGELYDSYCRNLFPFFCEQSLS